jgi:DNA-binding NarL/FixJ family response regulator
MHQPASPDHQIERRAPASVLVVEHEPLAAMRLVSAIERAFRDRCWVWSEGTLADAVQLLGICRFRLIVLDATLPGATLDAAVTRLRQAAPATPIVLHAWHRDASVITDAALAQAEGVAWKSDAEGLIRLVGGVIVRRTE